VKNTLQVLRVVKSGVMIVFNAELVKETLVCRVSQGDIGFVAGMQFIAHLTDKYVNKAVQYH